MHQRCFKDISWKFQQCLKSVSKVFQGSFKIMFKGFKRSFISHATHRNYLSRRRACFLHRPFDKRQTQIYRLVWGPSDFWFWSNKLFRYCGECLSPRLIRVQISLKFGRNMSINVIRTNFVWTNVSVTLVTYKKKDQKVTLKVCGRSKEFWHPKKFVFKKILEKESLCPRKICVKKYVRGSDLT